MALSGLHVIQGFAGGDGYNSGQQPIFQDQQWSETIASGTTTQAASTPNSHRRPVFRIRVSADSYVAIGQSPDASQAVGSSSSSARFYVAAGADYDIYCKPGDKVAFIAV